MNSIDSNRKKLEQREQLLRALKARFEKNMARHKGLEWVKVQAKLEANTEKLWSLNEMERTGGERDVVGYDKKRGEYIFYDCSAESPKGRRSVCYDGDALESRKKHKPKNSAMDMAAAMGIELLTEEQYWELQELGEFDTKTSSWVKTPADIRGLGRITDTNPTGDFEIFGMNSDGSDVTELTFNQAEESWPRWSPNGKWIAFHSNVDGNFEIYVVRPDGTALTRVTDYAGLDQFPECSPNGKQLAIRRDTDIYLIDLDGSNPIQLTAQAMLNQMASWSPDGKKLAFMSTREGYPSVFVMDADGCNQLNLTLKPDDVSASAWSSRAPGWSRSGQYIFFTSRRPETGGNENIFVMNADGTGVTQLTFTLAPRISAEAAVR